MTFEHVGREPLFQVVRRSTERRTQRHRHLYDDAIQSAQAAMLKLSPEERASVIAEISREIPPEEREQLLNVIAELEALGQ